VIRYASRDGEDIEFDEWRRPQATPFFFVWITCECGAHKPGYPRAPLDNLGMTWRTTCGALLDNHVHDEATSKVIPEARNAYRLCPHSYSLRIDMNRKVISPLSTVNARTC
jgi:hypothetical protein